MQVSQERNQPPLNKMGLWGRERRKFDHKEARLSNLPMAVATFAPKTTNLRLPPKPRQRDHHKYHRDCLTQRLDPLQQLTRSGSYDLMTFHSGYDSQKFFFHFEHVYN